MRVTLLCFLWVAALSISGCANYRFIDSPEVTVDSTEVGEVQRVVLLVPQYSLPGACLACKSQRAPLSFNLASLREYYGPIDLMPNGSPDGIPVLFAMSGSILVSESSGISFPKSDGWKIQTSVLLDSGKTITVIGLQDHGLSPGDRVRLSFGDPSVRSDADKVVLRRLQEA